MKKVRSITVIILAMLFLVTTIVACKATDKVKEHMSEETTDSLIILLPSGYDFNRSVYNGIAAIQYASRIYTEKYGVDFEFIDYQTKTLEEYNKRLLSEIAKGNGPDLIILDNSIHTPTVTQLQDADVILDVSGQVPNHFQLMEGLKNDYYYPVVFNKSYTLLKQEMIIDLGLPKKKLYSNADYKTIYLEWAKANLHELTPVDANQFVSMLYFEISPLIKTDQFLDLNKPEIRALFNEYGDYLNNTQYFLQESDMDSKTMYKILCDSNNKTFKKRLTLHFENQENNVLAKESTIGSTKAFNKYYLDDEIPVVNHNSLTKFCGLSISKHSSKVSSASDFINFAIDEETQMSIHKEYMSQGNAANGVVNKRTWQMIMEKEDLYYDEQVMAVKRAFYNELDTKTMDYIVLPKKMELNLYLGIRDVLLKRAFDYKSDQRLGADLIQLSNELKLMLVE